MINDDDDVKMLNLYVNFMMAFVRLRFSTAPPVKVSTVPVQSESE